MGGKKALGNQPSAKTEKKAKEKVVDDKTFGLKNKNKSTKVQQQIKMVQTQVLHGDKKGGARALEEGKFQAKKDKKDKEAANALLASLFKGAQALGKGGKVEDTAQAQINYYKDPRAGTPNEPEDTIITCKHFLDAIEDDKYGWRWECPNKGTQCQYMHRLPEGFVILSKKERAAQKAEDMKRGGDQSTLEEKIEEERALLKADDLTPVTKESFFAWKKRRAEQKQQALEDQVKAIEVNKRAAKNAGKPKNIMNGRALFSFKPELFVDDENAVDDDAYEEEVVEESKNPKEESKQQIDSSLFQAGAEDEDVDFD